MTSSRYNGVQAKAVLITLALALSSTTQGGIMMPDANPNKPYGIVYLITNRANRKIYIGQTIASLARRWITHTSDAKHNVGCKTMSRAIRKYGRDNFDIEMLVECETREQLDSLERVWIIALRSTDPRVGYNRTIGGHGCPGVDEVRAKISVAANKQWADPVKRAEMIAAMKEAARTRLATWTPEMRRSKMGRDVSGPKNPAFGKRGTRLGAKWSEEQKEKRALTIAAARAAGKNVGGPKWTEERRRVMRSRFSGTANPFWGKSHSVESIEKIRKAKIGSVHNLTEEQRNIRSARVSGSSNPMFGRNLSAEAIQKKKDRWEEFRATGRKMNLSEEAREVRRLQAAAMRAAKQAKING